MNTQSVNLMELGSALGREEMKKIMAGSDSACHKCCWDYDDDTCGTCGDYSVSCPQGTHTHLCDSSCNYA